MSNYVNMVYFSFFFEVEDIDGNFFEGDILLDPKDPIHGGILRKKRNARRLRSFVWQSKIIPYEISTQLGKLYSNLTG